ncbi:MAG: glucosaminidase domain-containing protein [Treponema sp.]|nr:glucosaminidase domain-containing protein [Treponema sp.]
MVKLLFPILLVFAFFSCASLSRGTGSVPIEEPEYTEKDIDPIKEIETAQKPELPEYIMGQGKVSADKMALFLVQNNSVIDSNYAKTLAGFYLQEAFFEGVNHDIAFVQMCLETGYLRYGGDVKPEQYNFAGMGAVGNGEPGLSFPDPRTGVRAHIQHLKAYGSEEPLNRELVNPRFRYVRRGAAPTYEGLAGTWAADRQYAVKINSILRRLYDFAF